MLNKKKLKEFADSIPNIISEKSDKEILGFCVLFAFLIIILSFLYLFTIADISSWDTATTNQSAIRGAFGDFVGGILNPFFSLSATILFAGSLFFQSTELKETRIEMKENTKVQDRISQAQDRQLNINILKSHIESFFNSVNSLETIDGNSKKIHGKKVVERISNISIARVMSNRTEFSNFNSHYDLIFQLKILKTILSFLNTAATEYGDRSYTKEMIEIFYSFFSERFMKDWIHLTKCVLRNKEIEDYEVFLGCVNQALEDYAIPNQQSWIVNLTSSTDFNQST